MKNTGFSLLETIVTVVILGLSLSGAVFLMMQLVNTNADNKDRVKATYLAQECMENIRNFRDTAWKQQDKWLCAFDPTITAKKYIIERSTANFGQPNSGCGSLTKFPFKIHKNPADLFLYQNTSGGILTHKSGAGTIKSKFSREITIDKAPPTGTPPKISTAQFTCNVSWGGDPTATPPIPGQSVKISQWLTNWQKK